MLTTTTTKYNPETWKAEAKAKVSAAQALLAEGLSKLQSSDDWARMLASMSALGFDAREN